MTIDLFDYYVNICGMDRFYSCGKIQEVKEKFRVPDWKKVSIENFPKIFYSFAGKPGIEKSILNSEKLTELDEL